MDDQPGDRLRDATAAFMAAAGFSTETEVLLGHKKVDIVAKEEHLGSLKVIGIECKDYNRPLTAKEVKLAWLDYEPLLASGHLHEFWLLTSKGISAASSAYISSIKGFRHLNSAELQGLLVDFRPYLQNLKHQFRERGLHEYYIQPTTIEGEDLVSIVDTWVGESDSTPCAVLAGYGSGKTSFALALANRYAEFYDNNRNSRIPIYLPLGEISSEQSLEGLLGKLFTTSTRVPGYTFAAFMQLNEQGRLLVLLDAFDEMKFALTWRQFVHNFAQINRLVVPRSRVVLLGRPNAFLSDDEYDWILRGQRRHGDAMLSIPGAPAYRQHNLSHFSKSDVGQFLRSYLRYIELRAAALTGREPDHGKITDRVAAVEAIDFDNIIARPVHARMIAELASDPGVEMRKFTSYDLYDLFINQTIEREVHEKGRVEFSVKNRREFASALAWWLWKRGSVPSVVVDEVPSSILGPFVRKSSADDVDSVRRDLVAACFLERKYGEVLFFPHRSFQEFLIAEYLLETDVDATELEPISRLINHEISTFFLQGDYQPRLDQWLAAISRHGHPISERLLFLLSHEARFEQAVTGDFPLSLNVWTLYILLKAFDRIGADKNAFVLLLQYYQEIAARNERETSWNIREVALLCVMSAAARTDIRELASAYALAIVCRAVNFKRFVAADKMDWMYVLPADGWLSEVFAEDVLFRGEGEGLELKLSAFALQDRLLARVGRYRIEDAQRVLNKSDSWVPYEFVHKLIEGIDQNSAMYLDRFVKLGMHPGRLRVPPKTS